MQPSTLHIVHFLYLALITGAKFWEQDVTDRGVIIHYHLFKNAGSSVDAILEHNFGSEWAEIEGPNNKKLTPEMMTEYILDNPEKKAISSHTAVVRLPEIPGVQILPIFFFRHPLGRIQSAYEFERVQDSDSPGSKAAKAGDFAHYLAWRLSTPMLTQVVNFHAVRLKDFRVDTLNREPQHFRPRSIEALKSLPVVGLVERFDESMIKFGELIRPHFPDFELLNVRANAMTKKGKTVHEKLKTFEEKIGRLTFINLMQLNALDMELYHFVKDELWASK